MFNIRDRNQKRPTFRLIWFVDPGVRPELRSRWSMQGPQGVVEDVRCGSCEIRNPPVTKAWDTETIAACA